LKKKEEKKKNFGPTEATREDTNRRAIQRKRKLLTGFDPLHTKKKDQRMNE